MITLTLMKWKYNQEKICFSEIHMPFSIQFLFSIIHAFLMLKITNFWNLSLNLLKILSTFSDRLNNEKKMSKERFYTSFILFFIFYFYVLLKTLIILYLNPIYSWQSIKNNQFVKLLTGTLICKVCFMLFTGLGSEVVG